MREQKKNHTKQMYQLSLTVVAISVNVLKLKTTLTLDFTKQFESTWMMKVDRQTQTSSSKKHSIKLL